MARSSRVNELLQREISLQLHTHFKDESPCITILAVDTAPDLRKATVYYSVIGNEEKRKAAHKFFSKHSHAIRSLVSKNVVLKYLPNFRFVFDEAQERGFHVIDILESIETED
ncbi:MAG: ribosome-binding factor A [Verrucomicrobia bacterium GWF2_51_19]|nr:MAG: ribosome-binding factor A [Verrucomicrobia bacterium GWF2_51_19]HCJ11764.1 30S ribosome-binding factor RbfA [Opitutae bacterium]